MNDVTLLRAAGPEAPALTPAARSTARAALLAGIEDAGAPRHRVRAPSRKARWRVCAGVAAVAASWAAAVVIAAPDRPGAPADSVVLVDVEMPTFPLSLHSEPDGLRKTFDGGAEHASVGYHDADYREGVSISVAENEPELDAEAEGRTLGDVRELHIEGRPAAVVHGSSMWCWGPDTAPDCRPRGFTQLAWERRDDQWVVLEGVGSYDDTGRLVDLARSLADRPQRVALAAELAPAGWSVQSFKMGRVLTLANDSSTQQTLTVNVPPAEEVAPLDRVRESISAPVGPQLDVMVNGRPAALVRVDPGPVDRGWFLQAQFEDGTTFTLQVPDAFTQEQVLQFAEQVVYTP